MVEWEVPPSRRFAFVLVLTVMAFSIVIAALGHVRAGGYLLAASMALAATMRAALPEKYCLGLLVRSRIFDVATAAVFAVALAVAAAILPA
ncbi:MAG: DUF3017 domain-containing protein [Kineosporiaceae bacterium]|nr:DUF3017 domain-containing protein [Kineosporiaceae bacterium]